MRQLSRNAEIIIERYLAKDRRGKIIEGADGMFRRVARNVALADKNNDWRKSEIKFYEAMSDLEFLPSIPVLANAGREMQQLGACFVLPVPDELGGIFESVRQMALIQKSGGGTGFSFSRLRPEGSIVADTGGMASGPVSFMKVFDSATGAIKEGGIRRGANMGILRVDHPDIEKFISSKRNGELQNFNISVAITDDFMSAVRKNKDYIVINPYTREKTKKNARFIFNLLCENAHFNGDPGVIFIDRINKSNPIPKEKIEATNPCSEVPLLPYECCVLGSINLSSLVRFGRFDYKRFEKLIYLGVHFLDNCIDASKFPISQITKKVLENRKIGLGIMGFADYLIKMRIPYNSKEAVMEAGRIGAFLQKKSFEASCELAKRRGSFPNIQNSIYKNKKIRNATRTTIAPTGTIGIIAGASEGIEPLFNFIFQRHTNKADILEFNELFKHVAERQGLTNKELLDIAAKGSLKDSRLPREIKKIYVTAHDISLENHVMIQAEFQKYIDNGISKTINLPNKSKANDVKKAFLLAYELGCKGISVYRDKSKKSQILNLCIKCEKDLDSLEHN